jgi:hypothetical protein
MENSKASKNNLLLHSLLFAIVWAVYMSVLMPLANKVTGPCDGTPGHDYTGAFIVLPLYFVLFAGWIYCIGREIMKKVGLWLLIVLMVFVIPLGLVILVGGVFYMDSVISLIKDSEWFSYVYEYGCFSELEVRELPILIGTSTGLGLSLYTLLLAFKTKGMR